MLTVRRDIDVSDECKVSLAALQAKVDDAGEYDARVEAAKTKWGGTKKGTEPFLEIKRTLDSMCWGARRCCYCEDSVADEIEHFRPKDLYPDVVFSWPNYLYACGPCNGPKNSEFAVFVGNDSAATDVTRARKAAVVPPESGAVVLIDPRTDDPLAYVVLDILDTFCFEPKPTGSPRDKARAHYTIKTLLLNERAYLVEARRTAYSALFCALEAAASKRAAGKSLEHPMRAIMNTSHRSVWEEMKRRRAAIAELTPLFAAVPEALDW